MIRETVLPVLAAVSQRAIGNYLAIVLVLDRLVHLLLYPRWY